VDDDVFIGMQAMVFKARIGAGCVVEPAAKVIGVTVPAGLRGLFSTTIRVRGVKAASSMARSNRQ
jgi:carbonic anhydrase/acetyltransferase-like protein (isoleucine patch superfamily)